MVEHEVKNAVENIGQAFEEFKKANDERLDRLKKARVMAYLDEKIEVIEENLINLKTKPKINSSSKAQENQRSK